MKLPKIDTTTGDRIRLWHCMMYGQLALQAKQCKVPSTKRFYGREARWNLARGLGLADPARCGLTPAQLRSASGRTLELLARHGNSQAVRDQVAAEKARRRAAWRIHPKGRR